MKKQAKEAEAAEKVVINEQDKVAEVASEEEEQTPLVEKSIVVVEDDEDDLENDGNFAQTYNSIQRKDKGNRLAEINDKANKSAAKDKSQTICAHMMNSRCYPRLTRKRKHLETNTCPFLHPRVCQRVLGAAKRRIGRATSTLGCAGPLWASTAVLPKTASYVTM